MGADVSAVVAIIDIIGRTGGTSIGILVLSFFVIPPLLAFLSVRIVSKALYALRDQIRRASKSICANLAEGYGKQAHSSKEFKRYILIAIGSSDEMRVWLRYCLDLEYISETEWKQWRDAYQQISKMLQGLHRSWE